MKRKERGVRVGCRGLRRATQEKTSENTPTENGSHPCVIPASMHDWQWIGGGSSSSHFRFWICDFRSKDRECGWFSAPARDSGDKKENFCGPKAQCHPSLGQRPRSRVPRHVRGLKARSIRAGDRAGLQPLRCFFGLILGRCPQAEMGRAVGAGVRRAKGHPSLWPTAISLGFPFLLASRFC